MQPGSQISDEASHYFRCGVCGAWVDARDLGQVFEHEHAGLEPASFDGFRLIEPVPPELGSVH